MTGLVGLVQVAELARASNGGARPKFEASPRLASSDFRRTCNSSSLAERATVRSIKERRQSVEPSRRLEAVCRL